MNLAIIQARMSSTRLPGKVLLPILGEPMLGRMVERVKEAKMVDRFVVATSSRRDDQAIVDFCRDEKMWWATGPLDDVLSRFYFAAIGHVINPEADNIIRLTGDCPLIDPKAIDAVLIYHQINKYDYTSNISTFPDGQDVEIFTFETLEKTMNSKGRTAYDNEHVTPFMRNSGLFKTGDLRLYRDLSSYKWSVDTREEYEFVKGIFEALHPKNPLFSMWEIIDYLEGREWTLDQK